MPLNAWLSQLIKYVGEMEQRETAPGEPDRANTADGPAVRASGSNGASADVTVQDDIETAGAAPGNETPAPPPEFDEPDSGRDAQIPEFTGDGGTVPATAAGEMEFAGEIESRAEPAPSAPPITSAPEIEPDEPETVDLTDVLARPDGENKEDDPAGAEPVNFEDDIRRMLGSDFDEEEPLELTPEQISDAPPQNGESVEYGTLPELDGRVPETDDVAPAETADDIEAGGREKSAASSRTATAEPEQGHRRTPVPPWQASTRKDDKAEPEPSNATSEIESAEAETELPAPATEPDEDPNTEEGARRRSFSAHVPAGKEATAEAAAPPAPPGNRRQPLPGVDPRSEARRRESIRDTENISSGPIMVHTSKLRPSGMRLEARPDEREIQAALNLLSESGSLQAIIARPINNRRTDNEESGDTNEGGELYEIVFGETRWRAALRSRLDEVPVFVRDMSDEDALIYSVRESLAHRSLSPLAEAACYQRLKDDFNQTSDDVADAVGKSPEHVAHVLSYLDLPPAVRKMMEEGTLSAIHARALLYADDPEAVAWEVTRRGLDIFQTEQLVRNANNGVKLSAAESD